MEKLFEPGVLTISRVESNQQEPVMMIQVRNAAGKKVIWAEASLLEFMRALSGIAETPCEFRIVRNPE